MSAEPSTTEVLCRLLGHWSRINGGKHGGPVMTEAVARIAELAAERDRLREALKSVVRVADRKTVEFDEARAAIAEAEQTEIKCTEAQLREYVASSASAGCATAQALLLDLGPATIGERMRARAHPAEAERDRLSDDNAYWQAEYQAACVRADERSAERDRLRVIARAALASRRIAIARAEAAEAERDRLREVLWRVWNEVGLPGPLVSDVSEAIHSRAAIGQTDDREP
jgi:hypothetical protein